MHLVTSTVPNPAPTAGGDQRSRGQTDLFRQLSLCRRLGRFIAPDAAAGQMPFLAV